MRIMRRRDFVKGIMAATAAAKAMVAQQAPQATPPATAPATAQSLPPTTTIAPGPTPWTSGLMEVKPLELGTVIPDAVAQTDAHFFNPQQTLTLRRLCAVMMPPVKSFPGALETGTAEFLDFLIGVSPKQQQAMYVTGLDRLEAEARHKFAVPFASATDVQADALIRPWLRTWMTDHPPTEPQARFINLAHMDIRTATVNSQAWSDAVRAIGKDEPALDLYWFPVDPDVHRERSAPAHTTAPLAKHA
jgi:hypothetical protein